MDDADFIVVSEYECTNAEELSIKDGYSLF
jgi:hypothetical protein